MTSDGLYAIISGPGKPDMVAGFVVRDGRVVMCAPIIARNLRGNLDFWVRRAHYLGP